MANVINNVIKWQEVNSAAVTKAQANVAGLQKSIAAVAPAAAAATGPMGQMATAGLAFGPAGIAIGAAAGALLGFTTALGGALHMLRDAGDAAEQLENLSIKTGVTASSLAALQLAFREAGVSEDSLASGLKFLNRSIAEGDPTLKKLGVTARSAEEAFYQLSDAIQASQDPAQTTADVLKVLGRAGTDLVPIMARGGKELKGFVENAKATGAVLSDDTHKALLKVDEAFDKIARTVTILKNALLTVLAPAFLALVNMLSQQVVNVMFQVAEVMNSLADTLIGVGKAFGVPIPEALKLKKAAEDVAKAAFNMQLELAKVDTTKAKEQLSEAEIAARAAAAAAAEAARKNAELLQSMVRLALAEPKEVLQRRGVQDPEKLKKSMEALSKLQLQPVDVPALQFGDSFDAQVGIFLDGLKTMQFEASSALTTLNSAFAGFSSGVATVFSRLTQRGQTFGSALKTIFSSMVDSILAQLARLLSASAFRLLLQILGIAVTGGAGAVAGVFTSGIMPGGPDAVPILPAGGRGLAPAPVQNNVTFQYQALDAQSFTEWTTTPLGRGYQSDLRKALMDPGI